MKALPPQENLQLLVPRPVQASRVKGIVGGSLLGLLLLWLWLGQAGAGVLSAVLFAALTLLVLLWGIAWRKHRSHQSTARQVVQWLLSFAGLSCWLAASALWLFYVIASEPEHTLRELLGRHWLLLASLPVLASSLFFHAHLRHFIDCWLFRSLHQQEQRFALLVERLRVAPDLHEASRLTLQTLYQVLQAQPIDLVFQDARLRDFHFATEAINPPLHLPTEFPLPYLFGPTPAVLVAPFPHLPQLTPTDGAWLNQLQARLLVPMVGSNQRLVGLLALGAKPATQPYSILETQWLLAIARQLAFVSERAGAQALLEQKTRFRLARLARLEAQQKPPTSPALPTEKTRHAQSREAS